MKACKAHHALLVGLAVACGAVGHARAGVISGFGAPVTLPGFSTGSIGPAGATPAPNNDNATAASPNAIPYFIFYNAQGVGITDVEYAVTNSGGTTEYRFAQTLINNTGQRWTGFRFELGYGVGSSFVRSDGTDALDFDTPDRDPTPTSSLFTSLLHQPDALEWTGGTSAPISVVAFSFSVDVPDNLQAFNPGRLNRFTLRQFQLPEPSSIILLCTVLAAAGVGARRKRVA